MERFYIAYRNLVSSLTAVRDLPLFELLKFAFLQHCLTNLPANRFLTVKLELCAIA